MTKDYWHGYLSAVASMDFPALSFEPGDGAGRIYRVAGHGRAGEIFLSVHERGGRLYVAASNLVFVNHHPSGARTSERRVFSSGFCPLDRPDEVKILIWGAMNQLARGA